MSIVRQAFPIPFSEGLDTKSDEKQIKIGKFLSLQNSIFQKGGLLQKRNGYGPISSIGLDLSSTYLTTLNGNLTAIGNTISAYSSGTSKWVSKGTVAPMEISTLSLIRNNINQTQCDAAIALNGLICTVYSETNGSSTDYKYVIADSTTGQNIIEPTLIPVQSGVVTGSPRVFLLGNFFIIAFTNVISAVSHLQYISISSTSPTTVTLNKDLAAAYVSSTSLSWDGAIINNALYFAYNNTTGGQNVAVNYLTVSSASIGGSPSTAVHFASRKATVMSVTVDNSIPTNPSIWVSFFDSSSSTGYSLAVSTSLGTVLAPTEIIASGSVVNIASAAQNGAVTVFTEIANNYSYDSSIPSNYINGITCSQGGTVGSSYVAIRSVGLASKGFIVDNVIYFLSTYQSLFQPTYFLINGSTSTSASPAVVAKIAYENGGGPYAAGSAYLPLGLPSISVSSNIANIPYLYKDLVEALNTLNNTTQTTAGGIYSQTGINLGTFTIGTQDIDTAEIGSDLHISGGFLWMYDGYLPVEHNFFLWPDSIECTWSDSGGSIVAKPDGETNTDAYYYQVTYEWSDNQGNIFRSAPSIPVAVTTTDSGTSGSIAVNVPACRLTYKTANPVKIVIYRWSVANQIYYQVTSIKAPTLNSTTSDSITFTDTMADASIVGNNIIYTTGGVVEDINAPASNIFTLFDVRMWLVDAEDPNLLWYSKQVIESTPVEMSDLFTLYIAPTTAAQGATGPITALAPMDDKLIIFKANAIYYINGSGPDNTGANSGYSQPTFITSTVGCANQASIVFMPQGLMFQSDKGIWLLGRDLSTNYIGAPVEAFNSGAVTSAVNIPETNQVRFTLSTGQTLMYDYYYSQWGTFVGVPAISSCIYQGLHTFLNASGGVFQETPGAYLDNASPVLMSFLTGHIQLQGISGYQRIFEIQLLGSYVTPHLLNVQLGYDFGALSEQALITPTNATGVYGSDAIYGQTTPYGGSESLEQWRIQPSTQKCQAFQVSLQEVYDPSYGVPDGAGFTMSAMTCVLGINRGYRPVKATNTTGTS